MKRIANTELLKLADMLASVMPRWVILPWASSLFSTAWDGDSFSTTAKTKIDMSAVFVTPANIDALLLRVGIRDSGSSAGGCFIALGDSTEAYSGARADCLTVNDVWNFVTLTVPTDASGDIYYQIAASGASTFDAAIVVMGYHVR